MKLEQVFYGRTPTGYDVLGASIASGGTTDCVIALCQAVGSPTLDGSDTPFLLQQTYGGHVYMICAQNGSSESDGRRTIFFHALVGVESQIKTSGISAAELYRNGFFKEELPQDVISSLTISPNDILTRPKECKTTLNLPAVIPCKRSSNQDLLSIIETSNAESWATFSWRPLKGFDLYGLDDSTPLPDNINVYSHKGDLLSALPDEIQQQPTLATPAKAPHTAGATKENHNQKFYLIPSLILLFLALTVGYFLGYNFTQSSQISDTKPAVEEPAHDKQLEKTHSPDSIVDKEKMEAKIEGGLKPIIEKQLEAELRPKIKAQLQAEIEQELRNQLQFKVKEDLTQELSVKLQETLEQQLREEIEPKIHKNVEHDLRTKLEPIVSKELEDKLTPEITKKDY